MTDDGVGIGELSRQVRDVLTRFEVLANRLDHSYVRVDNFTLYKDLVKQSISTLELSVKSLQNTAAALARAEELANTKKELEDKADHGEVVALSDRVKKLEDDKTWLIRLVGAFIILGVLGAIFVAQSATGAGP